MVSPKVFAVWCLMLALLPGFAEVRIHGRITITNPVTKVSQPLRKARIRVVLAEFVDRDTADVETTTNLNGEFTIRKVNPWFRKGYDARIVIVAESPGYLEVQQFYSQLDGYQARSTSFYARQNKTTTKNIHIADTTKSGPDNETVMEYEVGGLLSLDTASDVHHRTGRRAFEIFNEMTDHRLQLMDKALSASDFEEKEVSYPAGDTASYRRPFDYILINDPLFDRHPLDRSSTFRHELSHGIMADAFWLYPGWWEEAVSESANLFLWGVHWGSNEVFEGSILELKPSSHRLETTSPNEDFAWIEGWAEFLGEVTLFERYGLNSVDLESTLPPNGNHWLSRVETTAKRSRVEGEVAAALWDLYDPVAFEPSRFASDQTPDADMFLDGISDPELAKIWTIFSGFHPLSFTHGTNFADRDSFAHYWRFENDFGLRHEFKAILGNRGIIDDHSFPEAGLALEFIDESWVGANVRIRGRIVQPDPESQANTRVNFYLDDNLLQTQPVPGPSVRSTREFTFVHPVFYRVGTPLPRMVLAAHDDLNIRVFEQPIQPPANIAISGLSIQFLGVHINNQAMADTPFEGADIPDFGDHRPRDVQENDHQLAPPSQDLEAVTVTFRTQAPSGLREERIPNGQGWALPAQEDFERFFSQEVFRGDGLADTTTMQITVRGRNGGTVFRLTENFVFTETNQFGAGLHQVTFPLHEGIGSASITVHFRVDFRTLAEDTARATAPEFTISARDWVDLTPADPNDRPWDHLTTVPREDLLPRPPSLPKPSPKRKTPLKPSEVNPSRTIVETQRLVEAYARLERDLGELAHVLYWRLDPNQRKKLQEGAKRRDKLTASVFRKPNQSKTKLKFPKLQKKQPEQRSSEPTLLDADILAFLRKASAQPKSLASLPANQQAFLKSWRQRHQKISHQWTRLEQQQQTLSKQWIPARARIIKGLKSQQAAKKGYLEMMANAQKDLKAVDQKKITQALETTGRILKEIRLGK